jgi:hypothetical protein
MTAHALLSASGSKRWLTCTPSARLEATLPDVKKSSDSFDFSAEGTLAHEISELKLKQYYRQISDTDFETHYNETKQSKYYNQELDDYVDNYVLYVRSQIGEGDTPLFEQRVDFSDWVPDGFGTADVVILSKHSIRVIDLKFGKGIPVDAKDNTQLRLYALGAWSKFKEEFPDIKEVSYTIHQPRLDYIGSDGTSIEKLVDWASYFVKPKAKKAWAGSGEFLPGDHCQFCRAKATCRARADFNTEIAKLEFRTPALLDEEEVSQVLAKAQDLKQWAADVEDYALNKAITENVIPPGFKLGTTVTHRKIVDQALAATVLVEKGMAEEQLWEPRKMKSVASLKKAAPKSPIEAWLGELLVRPEGSPKLVRAKQTDVAEDFK